LEPEKPAEAAEVGQHFGAEGRADERLDAVDEFISGVDVHAGFAIGGHGRGGILAEGSKGGQTKSRARYRLYECDSCTTHEVGRNIDTICFVLKASSIPLGLYFRCVSFETMDKATEEVIELGGNLREVLPLVELQSYLRQAIEKAIDPGG
jgi:hypothetical protein